MLTQFIGDLSLVKWAFVSRFEQFMTHSVYPFTPGDQWLKYIQQTDLIGLILLHHLKISFILLLSPQLMRKKGGNEPNRNRTSLIAIFPGAYYVK